MRFQYTPYFAVLSLTAIIAAVVGCAAWQRRSTPARTSFALMMLAVTEYATVAALEASAIAIPDKIFWSKLEYIGSNSTIACFLIFTIYFTHHKAWLTRRRIAGLWIIPVFNVTLVATNEWHHLVWRSFLPSSNGSNLIIYQHGFGFYWVMACVYAYVVAGCLLLANAAVRPSALYRRQASTVLIGSLIPLLGSSLYMLNLTPPGLNITPMSFMAAGLIFSSSIFHFRLFDLVPVARDTLVESMSDGVLVLDIKNRIVDINPAAQQLIQRNATCIGQYANKVLSQWPEMVKLCYETGNVKTVILMHLPVPRYIELRISPLGDRQGQLTGRLIVLHDITQTHQNEVTLRQVNQRLQSQLLEIEILQVKLREQAIRDRLTGLFNRHYFDETVPQALVRATQANYPVALVMMDIDYFKKINDTFGHQAGDLVLQAFGKLLSSQIRGDDIAFRSGGEEFVVLLPDMPLEQVYQRAEQIRLSCQELCIQSEGQEIYVTVSGGIALFPDDGETEDELLQVADKALYAAKAAGRNCIQLSQRLARKVNPV